MKKGGSKMSEKKITRRKFLEKSAKIGTGLAVAPLIAPATGIIKKYAHAASTPRDTVVFLSERTSPATGTRHRTRHLRNLM